MLSLERHHCNFDFYLTCVKSVYSSVFMLVNITCDAWILMLSFLSLFWRVLVIFQIMLPFGCIYS